jgi:DNA-binding XRE family transcriptional regulator
MGKEKSLAVLAANLKALMERRPDLSSGAKLAKRSGIAQKTINNIENGRHDPKLSTVEALARAFNLRSHQLLCPTEEASFLVVAQAYAQTDDAGKHLLRLAAETLLKRDGDEATQGSTARSTAPRSSLT